MNHSARLLSSLPMLLAACGGGGGNPDAGVPDGAVTPDAAAACAEFASPAGSIATYPGSYDGDLIGAGADISAPAGACTDERDWFDPAGEDQVVALTGLTGGALYGVILDSAADTSFYVATDCAGGETATGQCLLFVDSSLGGEAAEFTAPDSGEAWVVIDTFDSELAEGAYTVRVVPAECVDNAGCTEPTPSCFEFGCVECVSSFDCDSAAPACADDHTCVASLDECTGDDAAEPDDGPTDATSLAFPGVGSPSLALGLICNQPDGEGDWFELVVPADTELGFELTWAPSSGADIDVIIWDDLGAFVDGGFNIGTQTEALRVELTTGTYYLQVDMYDPPGVVAAIDYALWVRIPECDTSFDCLDPGNAVCTPAGGCGDGPSVCTGDDATDDEGDDGPAAGRSLSGGVGTPISLDGNICNAPATESDWYQVDTVTAGQGLIIELAWTGTTIDLDAYVYDDQGQILGVSYWNNPEVITLSSLPVGIYYVQVVRIAGMPIPAAVPYTITSTRQAVDACATAADCDDVYSTQVFRGQCSAGSCQFIDGAGTVADGTICDSSDDCSSGRCSYIVFESDAADSVCTDTCTTTSDCTAVGTGLTCTSGLITNFCVPACTGNLECGADPNSPTVDSGQPWDYFTCNTTTSVCSF